MISSVSSSVGVVRTVSAPDPGPGGACRGLRTIQHHTTTMDACWLFVSPIFTPSLAESALEARPSPSQWFRRSCWQTRQGMPRSVLCRRADLPTTPPQISSALPSRSNSSNRSHHARPASPSCTSSAGQRSVRSRSWNASSQPSFSRHDQRLRTPGLVMRRRCQSGC